jgi:hypothetical protein
MKVRLVVLVSVVVVVTSLVYACTIGEGNRQHEVRSFASNSLTAEIEERLVSFYKDAVPTTDAKSLRLDPSPLRFQPLSIPGGSALELAARYYAAKTGDFQVSISDIVKFGFWPYALPDSTDFAQGVYPADSYPILLEPGKTWWFASNQDDPNWDLYAKAHIAFVYHVELLQFADVSPEEILDIVAHPSVSFWKDPFTGSQMVEGEDEGTYKRLPLNMFLARNDPRTFFDSFVRDINVGTGAPAELGTARTTSAGTCCLAQRFYSIKYEDNVYTEYFDMCDPAPPCYVKFKLFAGHSVSRWVPKGSFDCDATPPADDPAKGISFAVFNCGQRLPDTLYGWNNGAQIIENTCVDCAVTDPEVQDDYISFLANLAESGGAGGTSAPGRICECN